MTTKNDMLAYAESRHPLGDLQSQDSKPIYRIFLFEKSDKELIYEGGQHSGFPDTGCIMDAGFYYDLDDAIHAMNTNACDIRECVYNAGFILCHFPGLYESCGTEGRLYFVWNEEKKGFYQQEEPAIFAHMAY